MSPVFATIKFGPFTTAYHRAVVDDEFRNALDEYLTRELLPQVDEAFLSTVGTLKAEVAEDRFCGPNSLVRDIYKLEFAFVRPGSSDEVTAELRYDPKTGRFDVRRKHTPLVLWTAKRNAADKAFREAIDDIVTRINEGETGDWKCPRCYADLRRINSPALFDLSCTGGCFNYNFHRDPATGHVRHGHFFSQPPRGGSPSAEEFD